MVGGGGRGEGGGGRGRGEGGRVDRGGTYAMSMVVPWLAFSHVVLPLDCDFVS